MELAGDITDMDEATEPASAPGSADASPAAARLSGDKQKADGDKSFADVAKKSFLMRHLKGAELKFVSTSCRVVKYEPGGIVYEAEQLADNFFVVKSGSFREFEKHHGGERLKRVHSVVGGTFGSHELIFQALRKTSVVASDEGATAWVVPKRVFDAKVKVSPPPAKEMIAFLHSVPLLSKLNKQELEQLARAAKEVTLEPGAPLCEKGDFARSVFALRKGSTEARSMGPESAPFAMHAPMVFGESALYSDEGMRVRQATITCPAAVEGKKTEPSVVVALGTADIEALLGFGLQGAAENALNQKLLESITIGGQAITASLPSDLKEWIAEQIEEQIFQDGEVVFREGKEADIVYIVKRGTASISTKVAGKIAEKGTGGVFGELALAGKKAKRNATVVAKGPEELRLLSINAEIVNANTALDEWRKSLEKQVIEVRKEQNSTNESAAAEAYEADVKSGKVAEQRAKARAADAAKKRRESQFPGKGPSPAELGALAGRRASNARAGAPLNPVNVAKASPTAAPSSSHRPGQLSNRGLSPSARPGLQPSNRPASQLSSRGASVAKRSPSPRGAPRRPTSTSPSKSTAARTSASRATPPAASPPVVC